MTVLRFDSENKDKFIKRIMVIFKYIQDKEDFQNIYQHSLGKRLIEKTNTRVADEESILSKFKVSYLNIKSKSANIEQLLGNLWITIFDKTRTNVWRYTQ